MSDDDVGGTWDECLTCNGSGLVQDWCVEDCPDCGGMGHVFGGDE
jgi:DnaJ-class molecular chaperone